MNHKILAKLIMLVFLSLAITGCNGSSPVFTQISDSTARTATIVPTRIIKLPQTPTPTHTTTPTFVPSPTQPISSEGPFLVYVKGEDENQQIIIRDQDSVGARSIPIPPFSFIENIPSSISPDGKWLAFCSGKPLPYGYSDIGSGPYDLSLYLMHLPEGTIKKITGLLSPDYPNNFNRQAELLNGTLTPQPDSFGVTPIDLENLFQSLCVFDWSNSGNQLAFSGEMDGPSWDLYVYDLMSDKISRLSNGLENVTYISWSPNDNYILHWSALDACMEGCQRWWVVPMNGGAIEELNPPGNGGMGWASDTLYKVYTYANGLGKGYIYNLNIATNEATSVWPHQFDAYIPDPINGIIGVSVEPIEGDFLPGFYLFNSKNGVFNKILDETPSDITYWENGEFSFLVTTDEMGIVAVRPDGTYKVLVSDPSWTYVSPDKHWVAMRTAYTQPGIKLYTPDKQTLAVSTDEAHGIIWRPDSKGFYYMTEDSLYYVPVEIPKPQLVDTGIPSPYFSFPAWVP